MINFSTTYHQYENDLMELVRAFEQNLSADESISLDLTGEWVTENELRVKLTSDKFADFQKVYRFNVTEAEKAYEGGVLGGTREIVLKRLEKRYLKIALYRTLQFLTSISLPYGALTGIRPTKLYCDLEATGRVDEIFSVDFSVEGEKLRLIKDIVNQQKPLKILENNQVDVFVNLPFCPTRCAYCSFVSVAIDKHKKHLENYKKYLILELSIIKKAIFENNFSVRAVYVGGGTPTSLPPDMLADILAELQFGQREFTVEAGRPDTINRKIVEVLKNAGVTRVSINPQSFSQATLDAIGRAHTVEQIFKAYRMVKKHFIVNMDLICALPNETTDDFKNSVDTAISLKPANITVHTLAIKRGSRLHECNFELTDAAVAANMVDYARAALEKAGYLPYYMYRQKYVSGNLENVGYAKPDTACLYNVDIMEETVSVLAAGAGAISKRIFPQEYRIERQPNFKGVEEYISRFDEVARKTEDFWKK